MLWPLFSWQVPYIARNSGLNFTDEIISYADLYDSASAEARKMIVNCLIDRVDVFEGYKLKVKFNFHLSQFFYGLDFQPASS